MKITLETLRQMKAEKKPAVGVSCYTAPDAAIAAEAGVDFIVVGDSLAMTLLGFDSTLPATMEMMELFVAATRRGLTGERVPLVVGDMPLGSYQVSDSLAVENACRLLRAGADVVKIEGNSTTTCERIQALRDAGVGVMAHLGLQPQQKALVGGWKVQGKTAGEARDLYDQIRDVVNAGASVVLVEAIPREVAGWLRSEVQENFDEPVPLYGIGCGPDVDGQLLVMADLVGEFRPFKSRFAKRFAECGTLKKSAVTDYATAVRTGKFPDAETSYSMDKTELAKLVGYKK